MGYISAIKSGCRACESLFAKAPFRHAMPKGFVKAAKAGEVKICPNFIEGKVGDVVELGNCSKVAKALTPKEEYLKRIEEATDVQALTKIMQEICGKGVKLEPELLDIVNKRANLLATYADLKEASLNATHCNEFIKIQNKLNSNMPDLALKQELQTILDKRIVALTPERISTAKKALAEVKDYDTFAIAGQEIDKIVETSTVKKELIAEYVEKYNKYYEELLSGKDLSFTKSFKAIFGKDLSEREAKEVFAKYKEILEEPDFETYIRKLVEQVKKDYGIEHTTLTFNKLPAKSGVGGNAVTGTYSDITVNYYENNPLNKFKYFYGLFHELTHASQCQSAYLVDRKAYIGALAQVMKKNSPEATLENFGNLKRLTDKAYGPAYKKYGRITTENPLYKRGVEEIKSLGNYFCPNIENFDPKVFQAYKAQYVEAEAYSAGDSAMELYYLLTHGKLTSTPIV